MHRPQTGVVKLYAVHGDLTRQDADAIVNATNNAVRGGGGVDGAIHAAGGPAILKECLARFPNGLATGDAGWTTAGELPPRWVIHTVGPNYSKGQQDPALLQSCYRHALQVADELHARSVAFPLIGAGAYGWPRRTAIETAIQTIQATPTDVEEVRLVVLDEAVFKDTRTTLLLLSPPPVAEGSIGSLFEREPVQFGLRGDVYLWRVLRARFADTPLPPSWFELRRLVLEAVREVLGESLDERASAGWHDSTAAVYVPAFDPGHGMSAGTVHLPWWLHTGLPIILDRFQDH